MEADRLFDTEDYASENINPKLQSVEMLYNGYIKEILTTIPEPFYTYLYKVKKWKAIHPISDISKFRIPKGISADINSTRMKMMQLKIGGLKEAYGFSSGVKFELGTVIQAIASGRGLSSKDKPFIRLTSDITHSVTLLIDFSSSMAPYIEKVKKSVFVFAEVLNKLQLSFAILGYSENLWIIKDLNEKWDIEAKSRLFNLDAKGMGPESIAMVAASNMAGRMIEKGKVMFVITDGIFENRIQAKRTVQEVRKRGIIVIGVSTLADIGDVFPINILETGNLNDIWSRDSFMRIYSREFQSDY